MVHVSGDGNSAIIKLEGSISIEEASSIHKNFYSVLDKYQEVLMDLKAVKQLDVSVLQLIWSMVISMKKAGKKMSFSVHNVTEFKAILSESGFLNSFFPPKNGV